MGRARKSKPAADPNGKAEYAGHREKMAAKSRARSAAGREIGPLPKVRNPKRKARCRLSLRLFCETYLGERFDLAWGDDHLKVLTRLEGALLRGGLFALAMPRGSGKTAICEAAALWAVLYGHRRFVVVVGSSDDAATELLESIQVAVETGDALGDDFPEACHPVRELEGQTSRSRGQTLKGERTRITWAANAAVFPTVKGAKASGAVIRVAGITGRVRGMKASAADGTSFRPDFVIADDPQTDESAESLQQTAKRERVVTGALKGLAGPGKTISMAVPCTVIAPGDLSERLLDRERLPQFRGERMQLVYAFPERADLWEEYAKRRRGSFREGGEGEPATAFYRANQAAMDAGCVVGWPARFDPACELSAVQAAMNLHLDNPIAFAAEYQNRPLTEATAGMRTLDPAALAARLSGVPRGQVPRECSTLTAFIDCGQTVLWYAVCAWDGRFGGSLIEYGPWPAQNRAHFRADDARPSLKDAYPKGSGDDGLLHLGLRDLVTHVLGREYPRHETGEPHRVSMCLVDRGWKPEVVHKVCRQSAFAASLRPSLGHSVGSTGKPVRQWGYEAGELVAPPDGPAWRWGYGKGDHAIGRRVIFDADEWKTFAANRLTADGAAPLTLFGRPNEPEDTHRRLLLEHLTAEFGARARTNGGHEYEKWACRPNRENHLFDAVVGACVAASVQGLRWSAAAAAGEPDAPPGKRPKVKLSDLKRRRDAAAGRSP